MVRASHARPVLARGRLEIKPRYGIVGGRQRGLLDDGTHIALIVEIDHAVALGVHDVIAKYRTTLRARIRSS